MLGSSDQSLWDAYDVAMLDLDGVVYIGRDAVPGAPGHLARAREAGMHLAYVTNNASRPPSRVAAHLRDLGIEVEDDDVVTSAQAAARVLSEQLDDGAAVFLVGGEGLEVALREQGLEPVQDSTLPDGSRPAAVVSGFHGDLRWSTVIAGAILVREGLPWVASNTDLTVPTPLGPGPGNGALVGVVARFAEREPVVAGKPEPPLFEETLRRVGGSRPLVVGDRLDTDIEGANRTGYDSLLVMTGVTGLRELVAAGAESRPTYVAADLGALARPQPPVEAGADTHDEADDGTVRSGGWTARVQDGRLVVSGEGDVDAWWRVVSVAGWAHLDASGEPADTQDLNPPTPSE